MKIALVLVLTIIIVACEASLASASSSVDLKANDYSNFITNYESSFRVLFSSMLQISANAGLGALYVTAFADKLENLLNNPLLSSLWSMMKFELGKEPFKKYVNLQLILKRFDPNLERLGTRGREFIQLAITVILYAIEKNPTFNANSPSTSITNEPTVQAMFKAMSDSFAPVFNAFGFLSTNGTGPLFPLYYVLDFMRRYDWTVFGTEPLRTVWQIAQNILHYIQELAGIIIADVVEIQSDLGFTVNPEAQQWIQTAQSQVQESYLFFLNQIGEPVNLPEFRVFLRVVNAVSEIVPNLFDQTGLWSSVGDSVREVVENYASDEFGAGGVPELASENYEPYYAGLIEKILEMHIFLFPSSD